ncbi:MAG: hypothetical protein H6732_10215 [Alphaproteobacteria bacterium]|nr:hypothetical protein [Alphaproteobacteria bacterium]
MSEGVQAFDLGTAGFWGVVLLAVLLLAALTDATWKRRAFAVVNLLALGLLVGPLGVLAALVAVTVGWAVGRALATRGFGPVFVVACLALAAVFGVHKWPWPPPALAPVRAAFGAIALSYVVLRIADMWHAVASRQAPAPDWLDTVAYVVPFHMLSAGPIRAYTAWVKEPVTTEPLTLHGTLDGVDRIVTGLFKKFVLAWLVDLYLFHDMASPWPWRFVEIQAFYVWVWLDFSAYSDIAVGMGRLLGVPAPENFDRPFLSRNIIEFWTRWHISLGDWVLRNLFQPMQLALVRGRFRKQPVAAASISYFVAFGLVGVWHGLLPGQLLWGVYVAVGMVAVNLYRAWLTKRLGRKGLKTYQANPWIRAVAVVLTFEFVAFSMVVQFYPQTLWGW